MDEASIAQGRMGRSKLASRSSLVFCFFFEVTVEDITLYPATSRQTTDGKNPRAVAAVEILIRTGCESQTRHFTNTFDAHQKLATLSSNRPRWNGKMRVIGSRNPVRGAKGGSHGRNANRNEAVVTEPSLVKSCNLKSQ